MGHRASRNKYVEVQFIEDKNKLSIIIQYDHSEEEFLTANHAEDDPEADLSLKLIRRATDEMHYEDGGNTLTLIKFKPGGRPE